MTDQCPHCGQVFRVSLAAHQQYCELRPQPSPDPDQQHDTDKAKVGQCECKTCREERDVEMF